MAEAADDGGRRERRRRFARGVGALAVVLLVAGVLLGRGSGVAYVLGLVAVANGIGLAVAGVWLALGRNPLDRR